MFIRFFRVLIGIMGAAGVGLGAFGAHALKARLMSGGHLETWNTAVMYHLIHTVAALALTMYLGMPSSGAPRSRLISAAVWCWLGGIVLFSGSLYAISLDGPHWLGPVTPMGGLAFLAGWGCVLASGLTSPTQP